MVTVTADPARAGVRPAAVVPPAGVCEWRLTVF